MIIDIVFIVLFIISILVGYKKGFFKELYGIIVLFLSVGLAYLLKGLVINIVSNSFSFPEGEELIGETLKQLLSSPISFVLVYLIIFIILKIVLKILMNKDLIPNNPDKFRPLGSLIAFIKTVFILTFVSFFLSFTSLVEEFDIYNDSFLAPNILKLNPPAHKLSDDIQDLYSSAIEVINIFQNMEDQEELTEEQLESIKDLIKNDIITEDMIVSVTKAFFDNSDIDKEALTMPDEVNMEEVREGLKQSELYPVLKDLYDDEVITDSLITKIIEENELTGIDPEDIIILFQD